MMNALKSEASQPPGRLAEVARNCNEFQAQRVTDHPSRFGAFAVLPLPEIDAALREIECALDVLNFDGEYWKTLMEHETALARIEQITGVPLN